MRSLNGLLDADQAEPPTTCGVTPYKAGNSRAALYCLLIEAESVLHGLSAALKPVRPNDRDNKQPDQR